MTKKQDFINDLKAKLDSAVKSEDWELAARLRDQIAAADSQEVPIGSYDQEEAIDLPVSLRSLLDNIAIRAAGDKRAAEVYKTYTENKNELQLEWGLMNLATTHMAKHYNTMERKQAKVILSIVLGRQPTMYETAAIRVTQGVNPLNQSADKTYWFNGVPLIRVYPDANSGGMVLEQLLFGEQPPQEGTTP